MGTGEPVGTGRQRGWIQPDQYVEWEDIGQELGATVVEIGLPPQEPSSIWVRLADGKVWRGVLPERRPTEAYGWERLAPEEVSPDLHWHTTPFDAQSFLRVPPGYTETYVNFRHWTSGGFSNFRGFLFVQDRGALYARKTWNKTGMYFDDVMRSVDGGVTWQGVGSFNGTNDLSSLELARVVVLLDVRGKVLATNKGLPRVPVDRIGPWAQDPVSPLIFYPFGYQLVFDVWSATGSAADLRVDDFVLNDHGLSLQAGAWTQVAIPAEQLHNTPNHSNEELFPLVRSIRFSAAQTVFLDEIQLHAPGRGPVTAVAKEAGAAVPRGFALAQNFPNPFNPTTTIRFALPTSAHAELILYNLAGQKVATLVSGLREAGTYTLQWDGRDEQGRELASGVYLYKLQAGAQVETRKLLLLR